MMGESKTIPGNLVFPIKAQPFNFLLIFGKSDSIKFADRFLSLFLFYFVVLNRFVDRRSQNRKVGFKMNDFGVFDTSSDVDIC